MTTMGTTVSDRMQRIREPRHDGGLNRSGGAFDRDRGGLDLLEPEDTPLGPLDIDLNWRDSDLADGETRGGHALHRRQQRDVVADQAFQLKGDGRWFDAHHLDIVGKRDAGGVDGERTRTRTRLGEIEIDLQPGGSVEAL